MQILILGGTGFIGRTLCRSLLADGHRLTVLSRQPGERVRALCGTVEIIGSLHQLGTEAKFSAIINLAGEPIADARWTDARKAALRDSRIGITAQLLSFLHRAETKPEVLLNGSAIGFYGNQGNTPLTEASQPREDFSHRLCAEWEETALKATDLGIRVCLLRTGLVAGRDGGFLKKLLPLFRLGLGGRLGDGRQWMSWIHLDDHVAIQQRLLADPQLAGSFNLTAPFPVTNAEFTETLAKSLGRPALLPVPAPILKLMLGEMSELLLGGQRVLPERLLQTGYPFRFERLEQALADII